MPWVKLYEESDIVTSPATSRVRLQLQTGSNTPRGTIYPVDGKATDASSVRVLHCEESRMYEILQGTLDRMRSTESGIVIGYGLAADFQRLNRRIGVLAKEGVSVRTVRLKELQIIDIRVADQHAHGCTAVRELNEIARDLRLSVSLPDQDATVGAEHKLDIGIAFIKVQFGAPTELWLH
jgi:hypothetical protein